MTLTQNSLSLNDVEWKEFKIKELFDISGTITTHPSQLVEDGRTPRITTAATNNGLDSFYKNNPTEEGGVLTIDSATIGYVSYQFADFIATDHVEKISFKENKRISKNIGLFLKTCIDKSKGEKFGYGYKFSQFRINRQTINLPIDNIGNPNWQFMEDYIKQELKEIVQKVIDYYERKMPETNYDLVGLEDVEWKTFSFNEIFRKIQRGKRLKKDDHIAGDTPYVSSTSLNNGVDGFIENEEGVRKFSNNLSLANSGSVGSCFYHEYEYVASDHVTSLSLERADKYIYLFMATIIKRLEEKYSFNREINDKRIRNEKLILPVDESGNPYWEYMSQYMQKFELEKINKTLNYLSTYLD